MSWATVISESRNQGGSKPLSCHGTIEFMRIVARGLWAFAFSSPHVAQVKVLAVSDVDGDDRDEIPAGPTTAWSEGVELVVELIAL